MCLTHRLCLILLVVGGLGVGCSRTKDGPLNRGYQQMTARYNPLFNGQKAYDEALFSLKSAHVDVYDRTLDIYPFSQAKSGSSEATLLNRAAEKATKTIKEHSMMIRGKQKNLVIYDAYLLLGKAQALLGLDVSAQESFAMVSRNTNRKAKRPWNIQRVFSIGESELHYLSEINRIKVIAKQGNGQATLNALDDLEKEGTPDKFILDIMLMRAQAHLSLEEWIDAADMLNQATNRSKNKRDMARYAFIAGQLYENQGEWRRAKECFERCIKGQPETYDMLLEAQLRKTLNDEGQTKRRYSDLKKLLKEPKNQLFKDRIYYALSKVAKSQGETQNQLVFLDRCIGASQQSRPIVQAIAYFERGGLHFDFKQYSKAQVDFDSSFVLLPEAHPLKASVSKRREGLNALVSVLQTIDRNDSLLFLGGMSEEMLRKKFSDYIEGLKEQEELAIRNAERAALNAQLNAQSALLSAQGPVAGAATSGGWVFYNPISRATGMATFTTQWGQRPNVDNWRLQSSSGTWDMSGSNVSGPSMPGGEEGTAGFLDPAYDLSTYLDAIPFSAEEKDSCKQLMCKGWIEAGAIYRDQIGDLDAALNCFKSFQLDCGNDEINCEKVTNEDCESIAFVHYALYRLYLQREEPDLASSEKATLLQRFAKTSYASLLRGEEPAQGNQQESSKEFRQLVSFVQNRQWDKALALFEKSNWSMLEAPQASLLRAQAVGGKRGIEAYIEALTAVEEGFPNTAQAIAAGNIKMTLAAGAIEDQGIASPYIEALSVPHQLVILFSSSGNGNDVRNALARFHQQYFAGAPMSIRILPFDQNSQIISVDGFKNSTELLEYRKKVMRASTVMQFLTPYGPKFWPITVQNFTHFYSLKDSEGYQAWSERIYAL